MEAAGKRWITHPSRTDWITIWNLADLHIGNAGCAISRLREDVKTIADDPLSFWIGGGDYADYITYTNAKRFDPETIASNIKVSELGKIGKVLREQVYEELSPIKSKCLGLLAGNHETSYELHQNQQDMHSWLCQEMGVPNLGYCCLVDVTLLRGEEPSLYFESPNHKLSNMQSFTKRVFAHHGAGAAQTPGGKLNRLVQFMDCFNADIYFCAHTHDQLGKRIVVLGANAACTKLEEQEKLGIITGSFLRTYTQGVTSYGEKKGYRPVPLGARHARINPEKKRLEGTI